MIGFIGIKDFENVIYLYRFFINEEYRGKGLGTIALNQLIEMARSKDKDMSLDVYQSNNAISLYERLGFKSHYVRMVLKVNSKVHEK